MQITRTDLPKSRVRLTIHLTTEEMAPHFAAAIRTVGQVLEVPGFRPGKAPESLVRELAGPARILGAATDHAVAAAYQAALTDLKLIALDQPVIKVTSVGENQPFVMTAEVDVLPTITVPNLKKIRVSAKQYQPQQVTESDIDEALTNLRRRFSQLKTVTRPAQSGDWVQVSFSGSVDGVIQENLKSDHHPAILGSGTFLPDFEKHLVGMKAGEQRTFEINLPRAEAAPQLVQFKVTMEEVCEIDLPPLNDSLAKRVGKKSVADLRKAIKDDLTFHRETEARIRLEEAVLEAVVKAAQLDLPDSLVGRESARRMDDLVSQLRAAGRTLENWLKIQKKDIAALRAEIREAASQAVAISLLLRAVAEQQGWLAAGEKATDEAMKKAVTFLVQKVAQ